MRTNSIKTHSSIDVACRGFATAKRPPSAPALLACLAGLGLCRHAEAAFVGTNGLDPMALERDKVAVAVVTVSRVHVDARRRKQGRMLYRHVDLKLVRHIHGPKPTQAMLSKVPYATQVNSAWPMLRGKLRGAHFLMGWAHGSPSGLGRTVSFGRIMSLPARLSGPSDPRIKALERFLKIQSVVPHKKRRAVFERTFRSSTSTILTLLTDSALNWKNKRRTKSLRRYLGLLRSVRPKPRDPIAGVKLLAEISKFPEVHSRKAYSRWAARTKMRKPPSFSDLRKRLHKKLRRVAASQASAVSLRRNALMLLAKPPSTVARPKDAGNRVALAALTSRLKDPQAGVRRTAITSLLKVAKRLRKISPKEANAIYRRVVQARRAEPSPSERAIISSRIHKIW